MTWVHVFPTGVFLNQFARNSVALEAFRAGCASDIGGAGLAAERLVKARVAGFVRAKVALVKDLDAVDAVARHAGRAICADEVLAKREARHALVAGV